MALIYYYSTGIIKVFSSCHNLQTVYLRRCVNVTDDAVAALTQHCSHLEHLNLCGCINITDASLQLIALNCGFLQSLNISKTKVSKRYPFVHLLLYCWICIFEYLQDKMYYVPDYASFEGEVNPFVLFCTCLLDYEQSFFFLVHWAKHESDHKCDWRCEMGEARKRCRRGSGCRPCFSHLAALPLEAHAQYCTLLTKSEEKETPHSVLACFQICFVPARKNCHLAI